jgi:hypothetical protein
MKVHEKRALTPVLETAKRTLRSDNAQQQDNLK